MYRLVARALFSATIFLFSLAIVLPLRAAEVPLPYFDLGVDVTRLPASQAEVDKYLASVSTEARQAILAACVSFMKHPEDAAMPQTVPFCAIALGRPPAAAIAR